MDIPDILKIVIFEDFLKIAKKGPPQGPLGALAKRFLLREALSLSHLVTSERRVSASADQSQGVYPRTFRIQQKSKTCKIYKKKDGIDHNFNIELSILNIKKSYNISFF